MFVQQRRTGQGRGAHVGDGGQRFVVELAGRRKVLRGGAAFGDTDRDQFADMAQLVPGQHRLLGDAKSRQRGVGTDRSHARQVVEDKHALLAARRLGHATQTGVCHGTAQERDLEHAGARDVTNKASLAVEESCVFLAPQ